MALVTLGMNSLFQQVKLAFFFKFQISDEHPGSRGRRKPVIGKTTIKVKHCSGTVAVGTKRAVIKGAPHPTGISVM